MIEIRLKKELKSATGPMNLDMDMRIEKGDLLTLYGRSGAGKTSLFMMIAGLLKPDWGQIVVDGEIWLDTERSIARKPQERNVGMVFQEYALFPNMTVLENLSYALQKGQGKEVVEELIEIIDLGALKDRKPDTLSGGQKQRVALARALVRRPALLLLDEPLSALDQEMRSRLQHYILEAHDRFDLTTLLISHDVSEIIRMSDYVIEMDAGTMVSKANPTELFTRDKVNAKFQFMGEVVKMKRQDFIVIVSVLIGRELVKVVANDREVDGIEVGDRVMIASKAFNPVIHKIS